MGYDVRATPLEDQAPLDSDESEKTAATIYVCEDCGHYDMFEADAEAHDCDDEHAPDQSVDGWRARAQRLHQYGGVPRQRAKAVALVEAGWTYADIVDRIGMGSKGNVGDTVNAYRNERRKAEWLLDNSDEI